MNALQRELVLPAHDYVLKCSHIFNVLDSRGAIGVTERAGYFVRMRDLSRKVALLMAAQRESLGYPLLDTQAGASAKHHPEREIVEPRGDGPHDLLFEIGVEELPVDDLDTAIEQLQSGLSVGLAAARLSYASLTVQGTPRRVVARVTGLAARQPDVEQVAKGPAVSIAYDTDEQPTRAAQGFARSRGVDVSSLTRRDYDGKAYVVAVTEEKGRRAGQVLAELLPRVVAGIRFGKSMRWNESGVGFSRPIRWIVALLADEVVPFEFAGVQSGRISRGIRPAGSQTITLDTVADYDLAMSSEGILLDVQAREAVITRAAGELAAQAGGELGGDASLLREVANLVESPLPILGTFDPAYLRLPEAVLLAVMHKHQRYFPVVRDGHLLPYFVAVANGTQLDVDAVREGNQEVLRARYADAAFFYAADSAKALGDLTAQLGTLTFQESLGSVLDKVRRLECLVPDLCDLLSMSQADTEMATRAAALCKSDLATQLVVEFTSLQGVMGRHYAGLSGEPEAVALAIEEHYLPRFVGDRLPTENEGAVVGLADRLDSLVGLFAVGIRPTGAADPWGLRRAALGIVQLLVERGTALSLAQAISATAEQLPMPVEPDVLRDVQEFVVRRLEGYLREAGYRYDAVQAVLAEQGDDPTSARQSLDSLASWLERPDWDNLLDSYARCIRITRDLDSRHVVDETRIVEPATRDLYAAYLRVEALVREAPGIDSLMQGLVALTPVIATFFDQVLVMAEDLSVRQNRLALLQSIGALADGIIDLSQMEGF